jgi:hypothetical protein
LDAFGQPSGIQPSVYVSRNDADPQGVEHLLDARGIHPTRAFQADPFPETPIETIRSQAHQPPDARQCPGPFEADEFKRQRRERMGQTGQGLL